MREPIQPDPKVQPPGVSEADFCHALGNQHARCAILHADLSAMLLLCKRVAEAAGIDDVDGQGVIAWFNRERRAQLERLLLSVGDTDPAFAEHLQRHLAAVGEQAGPDSILPPPPQD